MNLRELRAYNIGRIPHSICNLSKLKLLDFHCRHENAEDDYGPHVSAFYEVPVGLGVLIANQCMIFMPKSGPPILSGRLWTRPHGTDYDSLSPVRVMGGDVPAIRNVTK